MQTAPHSTLVSAKKGWHSQRALVAPAMERLSLHQLSQGFRLLAQMEITLKQDYGQSVWAELESLSMLLCGKPLPTGLTALGLY